MFVTGLLEDFLTHRACAHGARSSPTKVGRAVSIPIAVGVPGIPPSQLQDVPSLMLLGGPSLRLPLLVPLSPPALSKPLVLV